MSLISPVVSQLADVLREDLREAYKHKYGKHQGFKGRRYRRGKNRCKFCGAPIDAPDSFPLEYPNLFA